MPLLRVQWTQVRRNGLACATVPRDRGGASGSGEARVRGYDADVDGILAAHGLTPQADGYNLLDLERFVTTRGWQCSIEPVSGHPAGEKPKKRFRALVMTRGDSRLPVRPSRPHGMRQARATGASESAALALAVVRMLAATTEDEG